MHKSPVKRSGKNIAARMPENTRHLLTTVILSVASALSAVAFMFCVKKMFAITYLEFAQGSKFYFIAASFFTITLTSLAVGLLLSFFSSDAAGSGIPQVKSAYWKEMGKIPILPALIKFAAGVLSIGGGSSLGREGPSVFIGSSISTNLEKYLGGNYKNRRSANLIGASAGLAAAFNTPLAAISFVIEEIVGDMNNRYLGKVVLSSVVGAFVVFAIMGRQPAFALPPIDDITWLHYVVVPFVAFSSAYLAILYQKYTLAYRNRLKKNKKYPKWMLPLFGGLVTWVVGVTVFLITDKTGIFGLGYQDLSDAMSHRIGWQIAAILVAGKLVATIASYSFGGCGGIFAPSLFIGAFCGFFVSGLLGYWIPLTPADRIVLASVGMSVYLGTLLHAPLTSVLIVFEMTHQFELVPGLMLGVIISQYIAKKYSEMNFYDALLIQDGHEYHKIKPPIDLQSWQKLPVSVVANPKVVYIEKLDKEELEEVTEKYPFYAFPLVKNGQLQGILRRSEIKDALKNNMLPRIHEAGTCYSDQTIKEVGNKFIGYDIYALTVIDRESGKIKGIITLHDLIRAQAGLES
ncbi:MAG: chloride channel protein [Candidatus Delongbacteria bacterium]